MLVSKMYQLKCHNQSFFGHTGIYTGTETLMKVLESAVSDRQTDKSFGSILCQTKVMLFNAKQLNRVTEL